MPSPAEYVLSPFAQLGRMVTSRLEGLGVLTFLFIETLYWTFIGPFTGKTRFRKTVFPLMHQIGVKSLFIVCLVITLVGGILVLQTADQFEKFGVKSMVSNMICIAIIRELGPLMTAIVLSGRVGAAFTAGLGSMVINEEVLALKTMSIDPVGYLVAPRFIAICIMLPCLTAYAYLLGNVGGFAVGTLFYAIPPSEYLAGVVKSLEQKEIIAGLVKSMVFGAIICMVACHNALTVRGGPEGVGRNTMISVVSSLVAIIIADALFTAALAKYIYN
jgi:phospholipid/cholesterol/gamma-HCH transport system permease protein